MSKTAFQGSTVNLAGEFIKTGITAPDFTMVKGDLSQFKLSETRGKFVVLNIFPSLDTGTGTFLLNRRNSKRNSIV